MLTMPTRMELWRVPMRLHVQSEQHRLWQVRGARPRLYEEGLDELLTAGSDQR
jgi:hypothetical protein